jgi:hypothetical protein
MATPRSRPQDTPATLRPVADKPSTKFADAAHGGAPWVRLRLVVAAVSLVVAACGTAPTSAAPPAPSVGSAPATLPGSTPGGSGGQASPSDSGEASHSDTGEASPSDSGEVIPSGSGEASDEPAPSEVESHAAPELESLLPANINSIALLRQSTTGDQVLTDDPSSDSIRGFLASVGKSPQDLRFAQAYDGSGQIDVSVFAFRLPGIGAEALSEALQKSALANNPKLTTTSSTVGGRKVLITVDPDVGTGSYLYQHDDVVFDIETQDSTIASQVLAGLP